ncbi:protein TSSC4 [Sitophilus oryzae]|uniref:U5 small nuclear ribonucleoprotein TSSC4 n=1 Tax=Sitophilus oryzae TaxID=7048 RepID=A0A6J2XEE9_SITOR|nr:protein TSSC4 [Sitophilus oryzae]
MRHLKGKESIFKKPQRTAPKNYITRMPDFKKNPHKWTKYSLEDVQEITDESNKKSAMDFLKQLANRRKLEQGLMEDEKMDDLPSKIVFNKHIKKNSNDQEKVSETQSTESNSEKSQLSFNHSKVIMPEYNIGQKVPRKNRNLKRNKPEKSNELRLDHLDFEDE